MNKFLIAALALAAATGFTAVPAQAGMQLNGFQLNGLRSNGIIINGLRSNGIIINGLRSNGIIINGVKVNGVVERGRMDETLAVAPKVRSVRLADGQLVPLR